MSDFRVSLRALSGKGCDAHATWGAACAGAAESLSFAERGLL